MAVYKIIALCICGAAFAILFVLLLITLDHCCYVQMWPVIGQFGDATAALAFIVAAVALYGETEDLKKEREATERRFNTLREDAERRHKAEMDATAARFAPATSTAGPAGSGTGTATPIPSSDLGTT